MKAARLVAFVGLLLVLVGVDAFLIEPDWIEVTHHRVVAPLSSPLKIAHLSDLHTYGLGPREQRMFALLAEEQPDVIVITGDSIFDGGSRSILSQLAPRPRRAGKPIRDSELKTFDERYLRCAEVFQALHAPLGVWLVKGNWEHYHRVRDERAYYKAAGIRFLLNSAAELCPGVWILGLDDAMVGSPDLLATLEGVPPDAFKIALFHAPAYFDRIAGQCNLALAGHTHGGQVYLPFLTPLWLPRGCGEFLAGWYEKQGSRMYVSRGLGTSVLSVRFLCRPELAFITVGK
jgi:predicted MPP superfamily phosphohydrolase